MTKRKKIWIGIGVGIGILVVIGALASETEETPASPPVVGSQPKTVAPTSVPAPTAIPVEEVTATQLIQERDDNAARFDMQRKGKWVTVTGTVDRIDNGNIYLDGGTFLSDVSLDDLPRDVQASVDKGSEFTATCKVGNYILGTMNMERCAVP